MDLLYNTPILKIKKKENCVTDISNFNGASSFDSGILKILQMSTHNTFFQLKRSKVASFTMFLKYGHLQEGTLWVATSSIRKLLTRWQMYQYIHTSGWMDCQRRNSTDVALVVRQHKRTLIRHKQTLNSEYFN